MDKRLKINARLAFKYTVMMMKDQKLVNNFTPANRAGTAKRVRFNFDSFGNKKSPEYMERVTTRL